MAKHEYSPKQALDLLLQLIGEADQNLKIEVQDAINQGKEVSTRELLERKKKPKNQRKIISLNEKEALEVAISALGTHFVHSPMLVNAVLSEITNCLLGSEQQIGKDLIDFDETEFVVQAEPGKSEQVEIELVTETQIIPTSESTITLARTSDEEIDAQQVALSRVREMTNFDEA